MQEAFTQICERNISNAVPVQEYDTRPISRYAEHYRPSTLIQEYNGSYAAPSVRLPKTQSFIQCLVVQCAPALWNVLQKEN